MVVLRYSVSDITKFFYLFPFSTNRLLKNGVEDFNYFLL